MRPRDWLDPHPPDVSSASPPPHAHGVAGRSPPCRLCGTRMGTGSMPPSGPRSRQRLRRRPASGIAIVAPRPTRSGLATSGPTYRTTTCTTWSVRSRSRRFLSFPPDYRHTDGVRPGVCCGWSVDGCLLSRRALRDAPPPRSSAPVQPVRGATALLAAPEGGRLDRPVSITPQYHHVHAFRLWAFRNSVGTL